MEQRDSIDFGTMDIRRLFIKLFIPTLLGLVSNALLNIADGVFVGRGVGSDALAAINIGAPVFLICTGISLMFGSGVSVVAGIHLGRGNIKAARINVTQAFTIAFMLMTLICTLVMLFPTTTARLFGGNDTLMPLVVQYLQGITPGLPALLIMIIGLFVIRLDGSPKIAMGIQALSSVLNIVLDWLFVFPLQWGIGGAAWATSVSEWIGAVLVMVYMFFFSRKLHFYRPKFTPTSLLLTARNTGYMIRMGISNFIAELGISTMMVVGNYVFISRLSEPGVAAFSIICYLFPVIFIFGNAIAQSALPIISYNHGRQQSERVRSTFRLSVGFVIVLGLTMSLCISQGNDYIVSLFLSKDLPAWQIAVDGLPVFSVGIIFFTLNIVLIGYEQSIEQASRATRHMLLRSIVFMVPGFLLLPSMVGNIGLWLAIPLSEFLTTLIILMRYVTNAKCNKG